jgi:hypothetical protein
MVGIVSHPSGPLVGTGYVMAGHLDRWRAIRAEVTALLELLRGN